MENRKAKKLRTNTRRITLIATVLAVLISVSALAFIGDRYLTVREVNFYGTRHLTSADLEALIGCSNGCRLFSVSTTELYKRLKKSPWVKDALVRKDLTGKITVWVTEATAIAVLQADEKPYLVDREGMRLEEIRVEPVYFLPVIKIDPVAYHEAYQEAISLACMLYDSKVMAHGGNIELSGTRPEDITLKIDNLPVKIGSGDLPKKLDKLNFVRNELSRRNMNVEYIDLRFTDKIIVKPVKQEQKEPEHKIVKAAEKDKKKTKQKKDKNKTEQKKTGKHKKVAKKVTGGKTKSHAG